MIVTDKERIKKQKELNRDQQYSEMLLMFGPTETQKRMSFLLEEMREEVKFIRRKLKELKELTSDREDLICNKHGLRSICKCKQEEKV